MLCSYAYQSFVLSVPGERYSRNASCALSCISTFLFIASYWTIFLEHN